VPYLAGGRLAYAFLLAPLLQKTDFVIQAFVIVIQAFVIAGESPWSWSPVNRRGRGRR